MKTRRKYSSALPWLVALLAIPLLALGLAWVSTYCADCNNAGASPANSYFSRPEWTTWLSFLGVTLLGAGILWAGWWAIRASERSSHHQRLPGWLGALLIGAALLRLALGVTWYLTLPQYGHGTDQEQDGYVMADAHERDQLAQKIAQSGKPILQAYQASRRADTYGGLLFISAMIYRYLGGSQPHPLSMVVVAAAVSSLAVLFTWAFARRTWDGGGRTIPPGQGSGFAAASSVAAAAAWGVALYPEAVLLGSAQMREAFIIPLVAASFYGLARLRRERSWIGLAWLLVGLLLTLLFSPPITLVLTLALAFAALAAKDDLFHRHVAIPRPVWFALIGALLLVLVGGWLALTRFAPPEISNPLDVASYWLRKSVDLQAYFSKSASGWLQKIFLSTPEWTHLPILAGYGVLRPFLPAALAVSSEAPIWPWITLWRAAGWTILLGLLAYAFVRSWLRKDSDSFTRILGLIIWGGILIASIRGGGDQDDNPRYRATFASIQIALAAWGWVEQRRTADPIFRRALVTVGFIFAWSLLWYLRRLYHIPWAVPDPFKIIGLGLACGVLYSLWDWARLAGRADR